MKGRSQVVRGCNGRLMSVVHIDGNSLQELPVLPTAFIGRQPWPCMALSPAMGR